LTSERIDEALAMMSRLYQHDAIAWDENRSRLAIDVLLARPGWGGVWLMEETGMTVGYLVLTMGFSLEFHGQYALLDEFFVDEPWRGRGIGKQALAFVEERCRSLGLRALRLEVGHENLRALELYRRDGFQLHNRHLMTRYL